MNFVLLHQLSLKYKANPDQDFLKPETIVSKVDLIEAGFTRRTIENCRKLGIRWSILVSLALEHGCVVNKILDAVFNK